MFWGCPCAQAVLGLVQERLPQGVLVRPVNLWLLAAPSPHVSERDWWVLALSALNAMIRFRGAFRSGGVDLVVAKSRAFLDSAWQDFIASL